MPRKSTKKPGAKRPRAIAAAQITVTLAEGEGALFTQIREQIQELIARGVLTPGMRLPPVRALARQLGVNQITVAKAYRELSDSNLIEGRRGGGSFVRSHGPDMSIDVTAEVSGRALLAERLYELARAPGVIAFSSNYPKLDDKAVADLRDCFITTTQGRLEACFTYDPPLGRLALREQIVTQLRQQGVAADTENVIVTSGGQQAIDLSIRAMVAPGAPVILEQPTYYGIINTLRSARARMLEVPMEHNGMDLNAVERHLIRDQARLIYTNPSFHNPTGATMSLEKRRELLALARRHGAVIVEDDHSPELRFRGRPVPSIRALAEDGDLVLYARGLGKVFLPGMRVGYLLTPDALRRKLLMAKVHSDLHSNSFMQEAVAQYLARGCHTAHLERMRPEYGRRQHLLHERLLAGMPSGATVSHPEGGLSLWLTLPEGADVSDLYFRAVRRGVAFVAGDVFYAAPSRSRALRISFGLNRPDELEEGVDRLCSVVKDLLSPRSRNLVVA